MTSLLTLRAELLRSGSLGQAFWGAHSPQLSGDLAGVLTPGSPLLATESHFWPRERVNLLSSGLRERQPW